jgi:hypothetical protein
MQVDSIYTWAEASDLENSFSLERFQRYIQWAGGNKARAFELYALNTALSESFYTPLHIFEVVLRNRFHAVLSKDFGEAWYDDENIIYGNLKDKLQKAKDDLTTEKHEHTSGRIIAVLTFGFWTGLLSPERENLWRSTLHNAFTRKDGAGFARKDITRLMTPIRVLRNRIAHHEPILYWNLPKHYESILTLTQSLSPDAALWSKHHSHFLKILPPNGIILA